jgi:transketolase
MNLGEPNLDVFAATLLEVARQDRDVVVVTGDSRGSGRLTGFCQALPQQVVELGIAEQNLVGVATGLASAGKKVFAVSPACFLTARGLEQIKNDVAYANLPVRLVGISAGVSYGALGSTHHSLHDLAVLQAIHNIDIAIPADNFETRQAILTAWHHPRPLYLRFGKAPMPDVHPPDAAWQVGKAVVFSSGSDVTFIAAGETVWRAVEAARLLGEQGLACGVIGLPFLRPFDEQAVLAAARHTRAIVTVEEHSVHGGLGSRCAALLLEGGLPVRFKIVAIPDEYTVAGSQEEIFAHYGITPGGLARTARRVLEK